MSNRCEIGEWGGREEGEGIIRETEMLQRAPLPGRKLGGVRGLVVCLCVFRDFRNGIRQSGSGKGPLSRMSVGGSLPPQRGLLTPPGGLIVQHESNEYIGYILQAPTFDC